MKAVKRFDPEQGVRLVSYALHWIKAEIHEYILKNWRMVKVATTKAQRKLFFNLRSMKQGLKERRADADTHRNTLTPAEVDTVARELNVKPAEVIEMETRLAGGDVALEPQTDDGEESYAPIAYLADETARAHARAGSPPPRLAGRRRHRAALDGAGRAQPPHRRRALAEGQRRQLGRHDAARAGRRIRRQRRAHPPDRGGRDEEDAQGLAVATGAALFSVRASEYIENPWLLGKWACLGAGLLNVAWLHRWQQHAAEPLDGAPARLGAAVSLSCWLGALACGRWIAFA
jgi:hypothetical protein